jgi:UDP-N-acetylmuramate dehydrogenase
MAEQMRDHTTMRVGGPADFFLETEEAEGMVMAARIAHRSDLSVFILGNGSNVIVRDGGFKGVIISTTNSLLGIEFGHDTSTLRAGAGETLSGVAKAAAKAGYSGFEEISGIPGTVGGAVFMNAGAYDREIAGLVAKVHAYDLVYGNYITLTNSECLFGYRTSLFKTPEPRYIILDVEFSLTPAEPEAVLTRMAEFTRQRNEKQPLNLPSAGSFFKRPPGDYAARLIEEAGLKGRSVGGAQVSPKHAGFIVNTGDATAADILLLAAEVQACVRERFDVALEIEPVIIGED